MFKSQCASCLCTDDGKSPIFYAAREDRADCISKLVLFGGDVNKCHNDGTSPICIEAATPTASKYFLLLVRTHATVSKVSLR